MIVGQGQLDSILHATPEDRRGFIEEAAGVLKHRKRKEKALRKLDADRGQPHPPRRPAQRDPPPAQAAGPPGRGRPPGRSVQADVRDARARLLADDLATARTALEQELADESVLLERRAEVEAEIAAAREAEAALEAALREDLPALSRAQETWFGLSGLRERLRGTASLAAERVRNAQQAAQEPASTGRDPEELEAEAARIEVEQEQAIAAEVEQRPCRARGSRRPAPGRRERPQRGGAADRGPAARRRRPP